MRREIVYIGRDFYMDSGTVMSCIYEKKQDGSYERFDWGFTEIALENGEVLMMRPATDNEKRFFEEKLEKVKANNRKA